MQIFVPKEKAAEERRAPMVPETVKKLTSLGAGLVVEKGIGAAIHRSDAEYEAAGAQVIDDRVRGLREADMVLRLRKPPAEETSLLREGAIHVSYLDPFNELELIERLAVARVSAVSMEMIPRTTIAQKMDALSSQANLYSRDAACRVAWRADRPRSLPSLRTKRAARPAPHSARAAH